LKYGWYRKYVAKPTVAANSGTAYLVKENMGIISREWSVSNTEKIVFLVNGDLNISNKIRVADGGFLGFIVSGDIVIDPTVNSEDGLGADTRIKNAR